MNKPRNKRLSLSDIALGLGLPVNKGSGEATERRLPQITGKKTIYTLGALRSMIKGMLGNIKPTVPPGRNDRFRQLIASVIDASPLTADLRQYLGVEERVEVFEGFGKPTLVSFDVMLMDPEDHLDRVRDLYLARRSGLLEPVEDQQTEGLSDQEKAGLGVLGADLFDRVVAAVWNNPELAPIAIRGRVIAASEREDEELDLPRTKNKIEMRPGEELLFDMRDLGYTDEIARMDDLYARYGAPASDPGWRP